MNEEDLTKYRVSELEDRVRRIEIFIFSGVLATAMFSGTLLWMIADLPSKIKHDEHQHQH